MCIRDRSKTLQRTIKGIEKKPFPYLLCVTNLIAHGIDVPDIRHENTLRKSTGEYTAKDKVEVIVTNPPFGGAEEKAISQSVPAELRNSETADLFLVHMMALLKDGGRCGLVLPDGFLFGTGVKAAIKKKLLEECNLHTIVRLPKDVFAPYTNINTNLLFFTKGTPTKGVWYYRLEMPNGYKHFSKTRPMMDEHFRPCLLYTSSLQKQKSWTFSQNFRPCRTSDGSSRCFVKTISASTTFRSTARIIHKAI